MEFNKGRKKVQSLEEKLNLLDRRNFLADTDRPIRFKNLAFQLLRDNLTLWTSDMQGEGEEKPAEGDFLYKYCHCIRFLGDKHKDLLKEGLKD